jgi:AcrR family transcriptional regulator
MDNQSVKPREKRHARTKEAILDAAREIIAEKGVNGLSMRRLARRIDYSAAGLYEYFGSKEEIITAVCQTGHQRLSQYMNRVDKTLPADEFLMQLGLAYIAFALQNPDHFLLMFSVLQDESGGMTAEETMNSDSSYGLLLRALDNGIQAGVFKTRHGYGLSEMGYNAWALVHGLAMLRLTHLQAYQTDFDNGDRQALLTFVQGLKAAT